jgi:RNA polymerase sigma factor (sigma-70 family)
MQMPDVQDLSDEIPVSTAVACGVRPPLSEQDWRSLVARYGGALRYTLRRRVALTSDVDDLVQQALLQAVVGWPTFRGEAEVSTWVFGIAQNLARNHVSRPAGPVQFGMGDAVDTARCNAPDPFEHFAQRERVQRLQEGLDGLPKNQTQALWLVGVDGLSYEEAATTMGVSVAAVKHRVARARARLREGPI